MCLYQQAINIFVDLFCAVKDILQWLEEIPVKIFIT